VLANNDDIGVPRLNLEAAVQAGPAEEYQSLKREFAVKDADDAEG